MKHKYSIIVPVRNNISFFIRHINGILNADYSGTVQYIAVDDASPDSTPRFLETSRSKFSKANIDFIMLRNDTQLGQVVSQNKALSKADGEFIIKMDSDAVLHKDWETKVLKYFDSDKVAAVGPAGSYVLPDWSNFNYKGNETKPGAFVDVLTGFFVMWRNLHPTEWAFDEEYGVFWHEESDLEFRMRMKGYRLKKCEMCVDHLGQAGDWKFDQKIWEGEVKNRQRIADRYRELFTNGTYKLETPPE